MARSAICSGKQFVCVLCVEHRVANFLLFAHADIDEPDFIITHSMMTMSDLFRPTSCIRPTSLEVTEAMTVNNKTTRAVVANPLNSLEITHNHNQIQHDIENNENNVIVDIAEC